MTHANAPLTPEGRRRIASLVVDGGGSYRRAAERFQCSPATAKKWADRFRNGEALTDRSSRPHTSPRRCPRRVERRIVNLRVTRRWGPHRIAYHLGIEPSLAWRVLRRFRMPRLAHLDQATGLPIRKPRPVRYERAHPGDLVHVDIKKLGRIPDGGGHRKLGRTIGTTTTRSAAAATHSCTTRSMTTPGSRTPRSSRTNAKTPPPGSGTARTPTSRASASPSRKSSPTMAPATDHTPSETHSLPRTSRTAERAPTAPKPTARSNASTEPSPRNGPTRPPTTATKPGPRPTTPGFITTSTTDHTPVSEAQPHQNASTTPRGNTRQALTVDVALGE